MTHTGVKVFSSEGVQDIETAMESFILREEVQVINVSITSSYNSEDNYFRYTAALAYSWEE